MSKLDVLQVPSWEPCPAFFPLGLGPVAALPFRSALTPASRRHLPQGMRSLTPARSLRKPQPRHGCVGRDAPVCRQHWPELHLSVWGWMNNQVSAKAAGWGVQGSGNDQGFLPLGEKRSSLCYSAIGKWEQNGEGSLFDKTRGFQPLKTRWDGGCSAKTGQGCRQSCPRAGIGCPGHPSGSAPLSQGRGVN